MNNNLLQQKYEELITQRELRRLKINSVGDELVRANDVETKSKLERTICQLETEQDNLSQQLSEIEQKLKTTSSDEVETDVNGKVLEIIGFDLGHGETAIARTTSNSVSDPQTVDIMNNKNSILTAVALDSQKGIILIGDDAYCYPKSESLRILFKSSHFTDLETSEPIKLFVYKCLQLLQNDGKITNNENTHFFVGSPAGWKREDKKNYETILKEAGMQNVSIITESRAAFLDAKESGALNVTKNELFDSVLIIDIGSSTTDFTMIKNYEENPLDFGYNHLGAGLLDIAIFNKTLMGYAERKDIFEKVFRDYPSIKSKCLLKCREVKEKYFSKSNELDWVETSCSESEKVFKEHFDIGIYKSDMDEILSLPIVKLDNNNYNWPEAFRTALIKCKESKEYQKPKLVLLTGGGSRMRFTQEICREIFSESTIRVGLEPHLTIAKGLAIVGRTDFKTKAFKDEVDDLIHSKKLQDVVINEFPGLFQRIATTFVNRCIDISLKNFQRWLEGNIDTLEQMERNCTQEINRLVKSEGEMIFTGDVAQWLIELNPKIEILTSDICDKYNVQRKALSLSIKPSAIVIDKDKFNIVQLGDAATTGLAFAVGWVTSAAALFGTVSLTDLIAGAVLSTIIGIIGGALAIVLGFIVGVAFKDVVNKAITENLKDKVVPVGLRSKLFSEKNFMEKVNEKRADMEQNLAQAIEKEFNSRNKLGEFIDAVKNDLNKRADDACVLIR